MKVICDRTGIDMLCNTCKHGKPHDVCISDSSQEDCSIESICGYGVDTAYTEHITKCISVEEYERINNVKIN